MSKFEEIFSTENSKDKNYSPGFMLMNLDFHLDADDFSTLTVPQLGTFFHEYIHYLQNVSTPFGLWQSMVYYSYMIDTYSYIQSNSGSMTLPLEEVPLEEATQRKLDILKESNGTFGLFEDIDANVPVRLKRSVKCIAGHKMESIEVTVRSANGECKKITLGAHIIKESMAAMYQELVDPASVNRHKDIPYNLVKILAQQYWPHVAADLRKMLALCFISLFSLNPGMQLIDQMDFAEQNIALSIEDLWDYYVSKSQVHLSNGKSLSIPDFSTVIAEKFKLVLTKAIYPQCPDSLDFLGEVIDRSKVSTGAIPLLRLLAFDSFPSDSIKELTEFFGIPLITTPMGLIYPNNGKHDASADILLLLTNWALLSRLVNGKYSVCPMLCRYCSTNGVPKKDECNGLPWMGAECPLTAFNKVLDLKSKNFTLR